MKRLLPALFALLLTVALYGQQRLPAGQNIYDEATGFVYDRELTFGLFMITPRSFGLGVKIGDLNTYYKTRYWVFDLSDMRHSRESRQSFDLQLQPTNRVSRAFIFGKQNQLYVLRGGLGQRTYLSQKARQRGVAVGWSWEAGPSLGLLKPYYLELLRNNDSGPIFLREEKYTAENADDFLDISRIFGAAPWSRGLDELKFLPGAHARLGAHFGFGAFDEFAKALEAGVQVDFFFRDVPIMVESTQNPGVDNSPLFLNLYLTLQFGKRW